MKRFLFWTPRILCLLFAALISLFALDVFGEHQGFWNTTLALLMHLIPTGILLIILAVPALGVGGRLPVPRPGRILFVAFWGRFHWLVYAIMSGSLFLLGALFLLSWSHRAELHART